MRLVRIFISPPGDCAAEREVLDEVVERINRSEGDRTQIFLRTFTWEHDVVPHIGPPPQAVVDGQTPPCDIFVGIMSARFGGDGTRESGTERELCDALQQFGETGRPWVLFYFNEHRQLPPTEEAALDCVKVVRFRKELETRGIVGTFAGTRGRLKGLFETIEMHLRQVLQRPELTTAVADRPRSERARTATRPSRSSRLNTWPGCSPVAPASICSAWSRSTAAPPGSRASTCR